MNPAALGSRVEAAAPSHAPYRRGLVSRLDQLSNRTLCLFVLGALFAVYMSNLHLIFSGDSDATRLLPLSILLHGDLYLDPFVPTYFGYDAANGSVNQRLQHSVSFRHGHWVSNYPMVIPILIAPLYVPLAWCIHHYHLALNRPAVVRLIDLTEKVSSAVIGSLSAVFLFLCLQHLTRRTIALGLTFLYALASNTWVIGSQALSQHGTSELLIAVCLWSLLAAEERPG